ncbi:predicted protein [Arabidopsis lyrata subsp. lyrata]|uniref:Predicted protein n=1 Tax=Arabidopsis lyrata subsp. lyrata TaxID=81972 RepID=D7LN84_ARALL|nr:predicted protein [Arabidopsis lyrata subsp. lyrata]
MSSKVASGIEQLLGQRIAADVRMSYEGGGDGGTAGADDVGGSGSSRRKMPKEIGRDRICEKFLETTGISLPWDSFKSKYDTLRNKWTSYKIHNNPVHCMNMLRMHPEAFKNLCTTLEQRYNLCSTDHISIDEMVAIFLVTCSQNDTQRYVGLSFGRSQETIYRKFHAVLDAVESLACEYLKTPTPASLKHYPRKLQEDSRYWPFFSGFVGDLDGTHVKVMVGGSDAVGYWDRHGQTSLNIVAICDLNMIFKYAWLGAAGSTHDSLVLQYAMDGDPIFPKPPIDKELNRLEEEEATTDGQYMNNIRDEIANMLWNFLPHNFYNLQSPNLLLLHSPTVAAHNHLHLQAPTPPSSPPPSVTPPPPPKVDLGNLDEEEEAEIQWLAANRDKLEQQVLYEASWVVNRKNLSWQ